MPDKTHYLIMTSTTEEDVLKDLMARQWTRLGEAPRGIIHVKATIVAWDKSKAICAERRSVTVYNIETSETKAFPSMLHARATCL